jgi:hypothetical protein
MALVALLTVPPTSAESQCEPYPVGRCGNFDREDIIFCFKIVGGLYVSGTTEAETLAIGETQIVHVRLAPTGSFVGDIMNAPLPFQSVYRETNAVAGLQMESVTCATFEWWAECDSWMGPYNEFRAEADEQIA